MKSSIFMTEKSSLGHKRYTRSLQNKFADVMNWFCLLFVNLMDFKIC